MEKIDRNISAYHLLQQKIIIYKTPSFKEINSFLRNKLFKVTWKVLFKICNITHKVLQQGIFLSYFINLSKLENSKAMHHQVICKILIKPLLDIQDALLKFSSSGNLILKLFSFVFIRIFLTRKEIKNKEND